MKSGAYGKCPVIDYELYDDFLIYPENRMAILINEESYYEFEASVSSVQNIKTIFIVTDSLEGYREMIQSFNQFDTYQLYRDYLDNFRINVRRDSR